MTYQYRSEVLEDLNAGKISNLEAFLHLDGIIAKEEAGKSTTRIIAETAAKSAPNYVASFDAYNDDRQQEAF